MWNNNQKCAVALCFDFDAESMWISAKFTTPALESRGEYGARVGVPRILPLLERHKIRATFFVPAETARRYPSLVKEIHHKGHEIAHHGDMNESPARLELDQEKRILETGFETLEKVVGE